MGWYDIAARALYAADRMFGTPAVYLPPAGKPALPVSCRVILYPEPAEPDLDGAHGLDAPDTGLRMEIPRHAMIERPEAAGQIRIESRRYDILSVTDSLDGRWRLKVAEVVA